MNFEQKLLNCQAYIDNLPDLTSHEKEDLKILCFSSAVGVAIKTIAKYSEIMKDYKF